MKVNIKKDGNFIENNVENDKEGGVKGTTFFCIDKDKLENLRSNDGHVIFNDGTEISNGLHWELTMLVLIDINLGIQPAGCLFSTITD